MAEVMEMDQAHEWISFEDPEEERTWTFDVTFMLSHWGCIFGRGCQGVLTEAAPELGAGFRQRPGLVGSMPVKPLFGRGK